MFALLVSLAALALAGAVAARDHPELSGCEAPVRTHAGVVCGARRVTENGTHYVSYLGVPYARQPLGHLRFKELQPVEPWDYPLNATKVGPICPQTDVLYEGLVEPARSMDEACIHANVHVPVAEGPQRLLPIFVFIHGGGFAFGSGDPDLHGPDYLVDRNIIVITFNYRLNLLGFLSLNTSDVPGNNGLRDAWTLLRWVQRNARAFGGDARAVTLGGQSAGAVMAHMLALSPALAGQGLFQRAILMSGVATSDFFSSSPAFAQLIASQALQLLFNRTVSAEEAPRLLQAAPAAALMAAERALLDAYGLTNFVPVVESEHEGVTAILPEDPESLMMKNYGSNVPLMIGFTSSECETFRNRFEDFGIADKLQDKDAMITVPPRILFSTPPEALPSAAQAVRARYPALEQAASAVDGFVQYCTEAYYQYPAFRVAAQRAERGEPTSLYRFSYSGVRSPLKLALGLQFAGAGHVEDLTYALRPAHALRPPRPQRAPRDNAVVTVFADLIADFIHSGIPAGAMGTTCSAREYLDVRARPRCSAPSKRERDMKLFYERLHRDLRS